MAERVSPSDFWKFKVSDFLVSESGYSPMNMLHLFLSLINLYSSDRKTTRVTQNSTMPIPSFTIFPQGNVKEGPITSTPKSTPIPDLSRPRVEIETILDSDFIQPDWLNQTPTKSFATFIITSPPEPEYSYDSFFDSLPEEVQKMLVKALNASGSDLVSF